MREDFWANVPIKHRPIHVQKRHVDRMLISAGIVVSTIVAILMPDKAGHATAIALATNLYWVWV